MEGTHRKGGKGGCPQKCSGSRLLPAPVPCCTLCAHPATQRLSFPPNPTWVHPAPESNRIWDKAPSPKAFGWAQRSWAGQDLGSILCLGRERIGCAVWNVIRFRWVKQAQCRWVLPGRDVLKVFSPLAQTLLKLKLDPESPAAGSLHISRLGEG